MTATTLIAGAATPLGGVIASRLKAHRSVALSKEWSGADLEQALADRGPLEALVLVSATPRLDTPVLDVDDTQLDDALERFVDAFDILHQAIPRLAPGAAVLAVIPRGHLGAWRGAHETALCGALAGLMRSVALETMPRGVRANVIAFDFADEGAADAGEIADLAAYLLSPRAAAITGELILANHGRSLQMREARNRGGAQSAAATR